MLSSIWCRVLVIYCLMLGAGDSVPVQADQPKELSGEEIEAQLGMSDSPVRQLIEALERSIPAGETAAFDASLNTQWLLARATRTGSHLEDDELRRAFWDGTLQSWKTRGLAADYLGMHFRFLRAHTLGGRAGLLFRSCGEKGTLNYCLLTLARVPGGSYAIDDVFIVGLNEFVSDALRRGYLMLLQSLEPEGEKGRFASLYLEHLPRIVEVNTAVRKKDFSRALTLGLTLPDAVRRERGLLLMRLEAAENTSLTERANVLAEWRAQNLDEMSLPLKFADFHIAQGRLPEAERLLRALDHVIGGDSYLKLRIGEVRLLQRHADRSSAAQTGPPSPAPVARGVPR